MVWRYQPRDNENDTSVTGWATIACRTALDFGLTVEPRALVLAETWLDQMTNPVTGRTGYIDRGGNSARMPGDHGDRFPRQYHEAMTGVGLFVRYFLGRKPSLDPVMEKQAELIAARPPTWSVLGGTIDLYAWYYCTQALAQAGGDEWRSWWRALRNALVENQRDSGNFAGSWDPVGCWGEVGGRVYSTALAVMCLQAPYRYARTVELAPVPDTPRYSAARRAWLADRYDRFDAALKKVGADEALEPDEREALAAARTALDEVIRHANLEVESAAVSTRYLRAREQLESIRKRFGALAPGQAAGRELERFRRDRKIRVELDAAELLQRILPRYDLNDRRDRRRLKAALEKLIERFGETKAAAEARELLTRWRLR
jgi:hypothetical protein